MALQLLSHLQDDALALLIPMTLRASRKGLTDALSSHYGSPGRLASYRREFDKTVRKPGEDPSNFAITLETLAVKAFGDMGQMARLRLICDRFIAGHGSCDLRRYLDCVPPDTPLRDIVDRCRVWESHADPEVRRISKPMPEPAYPTYVVKQSEYETEPVRVVTVNKPNSLVDQSEELLKRLLAVLTPTVSPPARAPELSPMDKLVQLLLSETAKRKPVPQPVADGPVGPSFILGPAGPRRMLSQCKPDQPVAVGPVGQSFTPGPVGPCGIVSKCEPNDPIADSPVGSTETPDPGDETEKPIQIDFMKIVPTDGPASLVDTPPSSDSGIHSWGEQWENMSISTADTETEQNGRPKICSPTGRRVSDTECRRTLRKMKL